MTNTKQLAGRIRGVARTLCSRWESRKRRIRFQRNLPEVVALVKEMAETGIGTDACLQQGCLPMKVHFYSPVPDLAELALRQVWSRKSALAGIDFNETGQLALLDRLGGAFGHECAWPWSPTSDPTAFYLNNGCFSYGCAAALHCLIRSHKPRRIIEIGSGGSSLCMAGAIRRNTEEGHDCRYTIVDPYPPEVIRNGRLGDIATLRLQKAELCDVSLFDSLEADDILFIDSGHTVRIGSDVNYLFLDVLPRLNPGVLVHVHDINLPYEYNKVYYTNPAFRVFWTEAYLLQAFLACNTRFEVLLGMWHIMADHMDVFCKAFPHFDTATNWANSSSFWIRSKP